MSTVNCAPEQPINRLAESFKETLSTAHVLSLTSNLTKNERAIALLDAASSLVGEGHRRLAERLLFLVKILLNEGR